MNGGSDHFDSLEQTPIPEAVYSQEGFANYPSVALMGSSIEESLRLSSFSNQNHAYGKEAMGIDFQPHLGFDSQQEYNSQLMQEHLYNPNMPIQQFNWSESIDGIQEMKIHNYQQQQQIHQQDLYNLQCFTSTSSYAAEPTPELLNLLQLPGCTAATMLPVPSSNISSELPMTQSISASTDTILYNQLNFPSQGPVFRELFHGVPHDCNIPGSRAGSCFDGMDVRDANEGLLQEDDGGLYENSVLDFRRGKGEVKGTQHHANERQRRDKFNEKYSLLRLLLPNPSKSDRASIVSGAIDYINELLSTVGELKMLVKKKKFQRERRKRLKMEDEMAPDMESSLMKPLADGEQSLDGPMRSSWLLRKSNETVIDVRIIDDEVNIKLTQRRKVNCLLLVAEVLDELQMELLHATGGNIGDYSIFMFNTKIPEGSSVYARAIAQKLIEALGSL